MSDISMRDMLEAGVHFGHQTRYWNPKMAGYLFGHRNKIHIINLEKTLPMFQDALNFASKLSANKGKLLFVGTKRAAQQIIKEEAQRCDMPFVNLRWLGGLLTNYKTVKQSINRLQDLEKMKLDGGTERMSKKEVLRFERELEKLDRNLSGIKDMNGWPDALFVIDVGYEDLAISEAMKLKIPVIGVVDSNNSPDGIDYIIPGNDDAIRSIRLYAQAVADAVITGRDSVAHLGKSDDKDEFVELDAEGSPIAGSKRGKAQDKKKIIKKKSRKIASPETSDDVQAGTEPQEETQSPEPEQTDKAVQADTKESEAKKPEAVESEAKKPEVKKPEAKKPEAKKPEAKKPEAKKPEAKKPEAKKPEAKKPETKKPETKKPETKKPETKKPETKKPETKKPETKKPETKKPETKKPEAKKPETKKPEAEKPETEKSEAKKPEVNQPDKSAATAKDVTEGEVKKAGATRTRKTISKTTAEAKEATKKVVRKTTKKAPSKKTEETAALTGQSGSASEDTA